MRKILLLSLEALTLQCTHAVRQDGAQVPAVAGAQAVQVRPMTAEERRDYWAYLIGRDAEQLQQFAAAYGLDRGVITPLYREHFGNIDFNEFVDMIGLAFAMQQDGAQANAAAGAQAVQIRQMTAEERVFYFDYFMNLDNHMLQQFAAAYGLDRGVITPLYRRDFGNIDFNNFEELIGIALSLKQ